MMSRLPCVSSTLAFSPFRLLCLNLKVKNPKRLSHNDLRQHREPLDHTLVTPEDPNLVELNERWESLPGETKAEVLRLIRKS
jgi:hypothetical protein